jgi:hypothetical protein
MFVIKTVIYEGAGSIRHICTNCKVILFYLLSFSRAKAVLLYKGTLKHTSDEQGLPVLRH